MISSANYWKRSGPRNRLETRAVTALIFIFIIWHIPFDYDDELSSHADARETG